MQSWPRHVLLQHYWPLLKCLYVYLLYRLTIILGLISSTFKDVLILKVD